VQLAALVKMHNVPPALVLNSDQTGVHLVPNTQYQRATRGAKAVTCNGSGEKRQITANPCTAADGTSLPLQLIYQGKTSRCLPAGNYRSDPRFKGWQWNWSENHWANLATTKTHVNEIVEPYRQRVIAEEGLPADQKCILLIDCWPVCTPLCSQARPLVTITLPGLNYASLVPWSHIRHCIVLLVHVCIKLGGRACVHAVLGTQSLAYFNNNQRDVYTL
jgi:hypothetical protein